MDNEIKWKKNCPKCGCEQTYSCQKSFSNAVRGNWLCRKCGPIQAAKNTDRSFQKTDEYREKMSKACSGKKLTNETKEKLSLLAKTQWKEKRDKMMKVMTSDEYKQKHKINSKRMWLDENKRKEILEKRNTTDAKEKWKNSAIPSLNSDKYKEKQSILQKKLLVLHPERIKENSKRILNIWNDKTSVYHTEEFRKKLRIATINDLKKKGIKFKYGSSNFNSKACEFIDKLNKEKGWNLQHALNGGEVQLYGYFVDGYDKERNIIFEYDERHHNSSCKKKKDLIRQKRIIDKITPSSFFRYDEEKQNLYDVIVRKEG